LRNLGATRRIAAGDAQPFGAARRGFARDRFADALRAAGDEDDLAVDADLAHARPLSFTGLPVRCDFSAASASTSAWRPSSGPTGIGFFARRATMKASSSAR